MCTSADRASSAEGVLRDGTVVRLRPLPYDDPLAQYLIEAVQQEYVRRYGGRDAAVGRVSAGTPGVRVDGVPADDVAAELGTGGTGHAHFR